MDKIIGVLILVLLSCQGAQRGKTISNDVELAENWLGDKIIADSNFVYSINATCKLNSSFYGRTAQQQEEDYKKCALSRILYDYSKLNGAVDNILLGSSKNGLMLYIRNNTQHITSNADVEYKSTLIVVKNGVASDSMVIYSLSNYIEASAVETKYYYIDGIFIYILDITEDESGGRMNKWEKYVINLKSGKLQIVDEKNSFKYTSAALSEGSYSWRGRYYLRASNKDNIATAFDINITSLNSISVTIDVDNKRKQYSSIKAARITNQSIKY